MTGFKSHFVFSRSQRNGIFLLVLIIIFLQIGYFFVEFSGNSTISVEEQERIAAFQKKIDSIKNSTTIKETVQPPFNPNYITDFNGYTLGLTLEEIDRLHAYRSQDKWINSAEEFQQVTQVSDSLLQEISPLFRFPEWVHSRPAARDYEIQKPEVYEKQDLNIATSEELREVKGIGEVLSSRIIKYRSSLKGFNHEIQLKDVYGLSPEVLERLLKKYHVPQPSRQKEDLNSISLMGLSELPYMNYELARKIISYREKNQRIHTFEELLEIKGFEEEKLDRIKLYLSIK
ncbi:ComEA family DNA-binding protein [Salinimicrobium sp. GXAS 041]|uniref:ComEA family DNA-binding protein n=1 Tax=Salinimicrobium sp. GXAS 041 TaxID=3400806 RepID=UPI003C76F83F